MKSNKECYETCEFLEEYLSYDGIYCCSRGEGCKYDFIKKFEDNLCSVGGLVKVLDSKKYEDPTTK